MQFIIACEIGNKQGCPPGAVLRTDQSVSLIQDQPSGQEKFKDCFQEKMLFNLIANI
jgi:hypothetical protein